MKIYIIPNRYGMLVTGLLFTMIFMGLIYANNSVFLIAFILASLMLSVLIETHRQLKSLEIVNVEIADGFSGSLTELRVLIRNKSKSRVSAIEISPNNDESARFVIGGRDQHLLIAHIKVKKRGQHFIKRVRVGTSAPLGLFWAWAYLKSDLSYVGYPAPEGIPHLPEPSTTFDNGSKQNGRHGEDFAGHKNFEEGSSWRRVDWKAVSRGRPWMIKQFEGGDPRAWCFELNSVTGSIESKLSQLSLWIKKASAEDRPFSLRIDRKEIPLAKGPTHAVRCLKELGLYESA